MIPVFKTHFSIGRSILKVDDVKKIAEEHNLDHVFFVEDSMTGFPECFRTFGDKLRFGLRFSIYNESLEDSTESKLIAFADGDEGCRELYQLFTEAAQNRLVAPWEKYKHLQFVVPFYDSYLAKNIFYFANCDPNLPEDILYQSEGNGLPYDFLIQKQVDSVAKNQVKVKSVFYENREDVEAFQTYKCICNRKPGRQASLSSPNLDHFGSDEFCIEAWRKEVGFKK